MFQIIGQFQKQNYKSIFTSIINEDTFNLIQIGRYNVTQRLMRVNQVVTIILNYRIRHRSQSKMDQNRYYPQLNNPNQNQSQFTYPYVQPTSISQNRYSGFPSIDTSNRVNASGHMVNHSGLRGDTAVSSRAANLTSGNYNNATISQPSQSFPQTYHNPNNLNRPLNSVSNQEAANQSLRNPQLSNQQAGSTYLRQDSMPLSSFGLLKMDGIFAESFKSLKFCQIFHLIAVFTLLLGTLLLYTFKAFKGAGGQPFGFVVEDGQTKQSLIPVLISAESVMIVVKLWIYFMTYSRLKFAIETANQTEHGAPNELANLSENFENNVSKQYLLASSQITYEQGLQGTIKNVHLEVTKNQIKLSAKTSGYCCQQLHQLIEFGMFICAIFIIVSLAQDRTTWVQKVILIGTIVYWFLQNYKIIVFTIILVLCPIITLGVIIFACVALRGQRKEVKIPQGIHPTNEQIINCGGTCSICMMDFSTTDNVVVLQCSGKHMFHQLCIKGWLNIKSTCPNCRFDLSTVESS